MNFLSKNMSFLIISVSTLNYLPLEHFSPLHFPSNFPPRSTPFHPLPHPPFTPPRDTTAPNPKQRIITRQTSDKTRNKSKALPFAPRGYQAHRARRASLPRSEATPAKRQAHPLVAFPTKKKHRPKSPAVRAPRSPLPVETCFNSTLPFAPRGPRNRRAQRVFQGAKRPRKKLLPRSFSRPIVEGCRF